MVRLKPFSMPFGKTDSELFVDWRDQLANGRTLQVGTIDSRIGNCKLHFKKQRTTKCHLKGSPSNETVCSNWSIAPRTFSIEIIEVAVFSALISFSVLSAQKGYFGSWYIQQLAQPFEGNICIKSGSSQHIVLENGTLKYGSTIGVKKTLMGGQWCFVFGQLKKVN